MKKLDFAMPKIIQVFLHRLNEGRAQREKDLGMFLPQLRSQKSSDLRLATWNLQPLNDYPLWIAVMLI
jgi:hypothetical protein